MVGKSDVEFVLNIGNKIASIFSGTVSPDHWKGWRALDDKIGAPRGTNAINWVIYDGKNQREINSEARNIISYMNSTDETGSKGILEILGYSTWFKREITVNDIANKLRKGGYPNEAQALLDEVANAKAAMSRQPDLLTQAKAILGQQGMSNPLDALNTSKATYEPEKQAKKANVFSNIWLTLLIIGAAIGLLFGFKSNKKRRYR